MFKTFYFWKIKIKKCGNNNNNNNNSIYLYTIKSYSRADVFLCKYRSWHRRKFL